MVSRTNIPNFTSVSNLLIQVALGIPVTSDTDVAAIDVFENLHGNIIIVEWPELIMNHLSVKDFYLIELELIDLSKRHLKMFHSKKKRFNEF